MFVSCVIYESSVTYSVFMFLLKEMYISYRFIMISLKLLYEYSCEASLSLPGFTLFTLLALNENNKTSLHFKC